MRCPACKEPLREKGAGKMTLDVCYGGCGGIWFDATELERLDARAAASLHTIWQVAPGVPDLNEARMCPRCPEQILARKWFSDQKKVEIDQCPGCNGIWLDAGEFTRIYDEIKGSKVASGLYAIAIAEAAAVVSRQHPRASEGNSQARTP